MALAAAGYADFPLIGYHFEKTMIVSRNLAPVFYSVAMGVEAITALAFGRLFDRLGIQVIIVAVLLSSLFAPLVFLGGFVLSLGELLKAQIPVPPGFAVTTETYNRFIKENGLDSEIERLLKPVRSEDTGSIDAASQASRAASVR